MRRPSSFPIALVSLVSQRHTPSRTRTARPGYPVTRHIHGSFSTVNGLLRAVGSAVCCLALGLLACGGDGPSGPPPVKHLYFSQDANGNGLFELSLTTGTATLVGAGATATSSSTIGLTETADPAVLLGSIWTDVAIIAADGSGASVLANSAGAEALAMNIATGILYGGINGDFFTIAPTTGAQAAILASPGTDIEGLAVNASAGVIYGISGEATNLYVYSIAGNSWDIIGDTGRDWSNAGLAYDHLANVLYAIDDHTDALYRIDPGTAVATLVGPLGTEAAGGLAFVVE